MALWFIPAVCRAESGEAQPDYVGININGKLTTDMEAILWKDGSLSLPVKYLAEMLDIQAAQTTTDHAVTFTDPVNAQVVRVDPARKEVICGQQVYSSIPHGIQYVEESMLTKEEVYIPAELLGRLMGVTFAFDKNQQAVQLSVSRPIKILLKYMAQDPGSQTDESLYDNAVEADPHRVLETVTLTFDSNRRQNVMGQQGSWSGSGSQTGYLYSGANLSTEFQGYYKGVPYSITPRWGVVNGQLGLQDLRLKTEFDKGKLHVLGGNIDPSLTRLVAPSTQVLGVQVSSQNAAYTEIASVPQRVIEGTVTEPGEVTLRVNGKVYSSQRPIKKRYRFDHVSLESNTANGLQVVQTLKDGKEVILHEETIKTYSQTLPAGEKAYSYFMGRVPFQFRPLGFKTSNALTGNTNGFLLPQSNKWVTGGRYFYGVNDRLTIGIASAADKVFGAPQSSQLGNFISRSRSANLLGLTPYYRDYNMLTGQNMGVSMLYKLSPRSLLTGDLAVSHVQYLNANMLQPDGNFSPAGEATWSYGGEHYAVEVSAYYYGSSYYTPLTLMDNGMFDRRGVRSRIGGKLWGFNYGLNLERFQSNLSGVLSEGLINGKRWSGSLSRSLGPYTDVALSGNLTQGESERQTLNWYDYNFMLSQRLPLGMRLDLDMRRTTNRQYFNPLNPTEFISSYEQTYASDIVNASLDIPLPGQNALEVGTRFMRNNNGNAGNLTTTLGTVNIGFRTRWKNLSFSPTAQRSIWGNKELSSLGAGLSYTFPNGMQCGLSYYYNNTTFPSLSALFGASQQTSHTFQLNFRNTLAFVDKRPVSIGQRDEQGGMLIGQVFLDQNQDGEWQPQEPGLKDIPLAINRTRKLMTRRKGRFAINRLPRGPVRVGFDMEKLPINMSQTTPDALAILEPGRTTRVKLGVALTPGTLSGTVHLKDATGNGKEATDVLVALYDIETDTQVKFTYANREGHFDFSEVPPGKYRLKLDPQQLNQRAIKVLDSPAVVSVPILYEDFYDKSGLDFSALQLAQ